MVIRGASSASVNWAAIAGGIALCVVVGAGCSREAEETGRPPVPVPAPAPAPVQTATSSNDPPPRAPRTLRAVVVTSLQTDAAAVPATPRLAADFVITLRNADGSPLSFAKAEILAAAWGVVKRMELQARDRLTFSLDELRGLLAANFVKGQNVARVYLYIESMGYVPTRSHRFLWDGGPEYQERAKELVLGFPSGKSVQVDRAGEYELDLVLRSPEPRSLRFVDDNGRPVEGVAVASYMFWSAYNHCAALSGADLLGNGVSDREGRVRIADGDFEYALTIDKRFHVLQHHDTYRDRFVGFLERGETIVALHAMATGPLELWLTRSDQPLAKTVILGRLADRGCGVYWGPLATTDEEGRIFLPEFCHEMYESVFINDASGSTVWQADPREWQGQEVVRANLGGALPGER